VALILAGPTDWGAVPDYFIVLSILGAAVSLLLQRRWDRRRDLAERNRQARLKDLQEAWAALAPLAALPGGLDNNELALPFAAAVRQLQLTGSESLLGEREGVTTLLLRQGERGEPMSINLIPLINAVRDDYRKLMDLDPTDRSYEPFYIMSRADAALLRGAASRGPIIPTNSPESGKFP
jgi:hypothetical protein